MRVAHWAMTPDVQALIRAGAPVDADRLAEAAVALGDLLPAAAATRDRQHVSPFASSRRPPACQRLSVLTGDRASAWLIARR